MKGLFVLLALTPTLAFAQLPPPPGDLVDEGKPNVITIDPPPVVVNGKKASDLKEDELRDFLQEKVKTVEQQDGQVEIVRVSPGYPVSIRLPEVPKAISIGDKGLLNVEQNGRILEITAKQKNGETPVKVILSGGRILPYHVFIAPTYVTGDSIVSVEGTSSGPARTRGQPVNESRLREFLYIIGNYDLLLQEGGIDHRKVRRDQIFRESKSTGFTLYYLYRIDGAIAFSFRYKNRDLRAVRLDESRIRIAIGNSVFVPDYVAFSKPTLQIGESATGQVIVFSPTFRPDQPLEVLWK